VLLLQDEGLEIVVLGAGIEAGTGLGDPREIAVTEDLGIWVVGLQATEQGVHRTFLGRGTRIVGFALGIEASFVADAYRVGVVAAGVGSDHFFGTALVELAVLRDVIVVAGAFPAFALVTGFEVFNRKVMCDFRGRTMNNDQVYSAHGSILLADAALDCHRT